MTTPERSSALSLQSQSSSEDWAAATLAYLCFLVEEEGGGVRAALFVTNGHGEPLEFCFTRVDLPSDFLWEPGALHRRAAADLARVLFAEARHRPDIALFLDEETFPDLLAEDLAVEFPVALVDGTEERPVRWAGPGPAANSPLANLVELLSSRRRLLEPFERAALGLEEAYRHR